MSRLRHLAPAAIVSAALSVASAQAQGLNAWCEDHARRSCGDEARNLSLADCMNEYDAWPSLPNECVGEIQTMIEMEREALADTGRRRQEPGLQGGGPWTGSEPRRRGERGWNMMGYSYGGILREGPGVQFRRVGRLRDGEPFDILDDTGIWFDGYKWFRVSSSQGTGFHWGGIFCTEGGEAVEGVFGSCN